jgi:hypothetical protein
MKIKTVLSILSPILLSGVILGSILNATSCSKSISANDLYSKIDTQLNKNKVSYSSEIYDYSSVAIDDAGMCTALQSAFMGDFKQICFNTIVQNKILGDDLDSSLSIFQAQDEPSIKIKSYTINNTNISFQVEIRVTIDIDDVTEVVTSTGFTSVKFIGNDIVYNFKVESNGSIINQENLSYSISSKPGETPLLRVTDLLAEHGDTAYYDYAIDSASQTTNKEKTLSFAVKSGQNPAAASMTMNLAYD